MSYSDHLPDGLSLDGESEAVRDMVEWLFENYEDPVQNVPIADDGEYFFKPGDPKDTRDLLEEQFDDASEADINRAEELINAHSAEWVRTGRYP